MTDSSTTTSAQESNSARDSFYSKMFWVACAGLFGMLGLGITGLVNQAGTNAKYGIQIEGMREELKSLRESIVSTAASRYTGADAAIDRKIVADQIASMRDSWTKMFDTQAEMNSLQTRQILELSIFKAKVEERLKLGTSGAVTTPTP